MLESQTAPSAQQWCQECGGALRLSTLVDKYVHVDQNTWTAARGHEARLPDGEALP